jgi:hypothetical protein
MTMIEVMLAAAVLTAVLMLLSYVLLQAVLFCIRLYFIGLFVAKAADTQMLHAPITFTRCFIFGNAVFERWRQFRDNRYIVEGIKWKADALEATVPKTWNPPIAGMSASAPEPPEVHPISYRPMPFIPELVNPLTGKPRPLTGFPDRPSNPGQSFIDPENHDVSQAWEHGHRVTHGRAHPIGNRAIPRTAGNPGPVSLRQQELDEDLLR